MLVDVTSIRLVQGKYHFNDTFWPAQAFVAIS